MKDGDLIFGLMASFNKEAFSFDDLRHLAAPFNVSAPSLRTNLSRMAAAKLVQPIRVGRSASYRFGERGLRIARNVSHGFRMLDWNGWDGAYWGVTYSVPEEYAESRHSIRKKLSLYRFACLNPGLWIRPAHPSERIPEILDGILSSGFCRLIRFYPHEEFSPEQAAALWNLGAVNARFGEGLSLLDQSERMLPTLSPQLALVERMTVGDTLVSIIFDDPMLPPKFLPPDWHGDSIRQRFSRFDSLALKQSKPYWEQIIKEGSV
jgi:DNA-binding transcriptional regulator PaaX